MEDFIELRFKNEKALLSEQIFSDKTFPVKVLSGENEEVSVVLAYDGNKTLFDAYMLKLADYILKRYEKKLLKRIILTKWSGFPYQLCEVLDKISEIDEDEAIGKNARLNIVKKELTEYFSTDRRARLTGLVLFRLPRYIRLLNRVAEQIIEIYHTQKEYEEFVSLLRYFVNVQGERPNLIHLYVHKQGMYTVLDENNEDITEECIQDFAPMSDIPQENFDDLLISVLITLAPEKIVVHNGENIKNQELFDTIKKVFEKVEYCSG